MPRARRPFLHGRSFCASSSWRAPLLLQALQRRLSISTRSTIFTWVFLLRQLKLPCPSPIASTGEETFHWHELDDFRMDVPLRQLKSTWPSPLASTVQETFRRHELVAGAVYNKPAWLRGWKLDTKGKPVARSRWLARGGLVSPAFKHISFSK